MYQRENYRTADAIGVGGKPSSRAGSGARGSGEEMGSSQQLRGTKDGLIDADLKAAGSSTKTVDVLASQENGGEYRSNRNKYAGVGGRGSSPAASVPPSQDSRFFHSGTEFDDDTTSLDSTPRRHDFEIGSRTSFSSASPFNSAEVGIGVEGDSNRSGGGGSTKSSTSISSRSSKGPESESVRKRRSGPISSTAGDSGTDVSHIAASPAASASSRSSISGTSNGHGSDARPTSGISAGPGGVPFGASALRKSLSIDGRPRPRGLRPRSSNGNAIHRVASNSGLPYSSSRRPNSFSKGSGSPANSEAGSRNSQDLDRLAAEVAAPGVPFHVVVRSAIKIESIMRVLLARGYVRRKLVSEVTAFSLIMERGIEVIKHAFSGKGKPKVVTVNFVSRKGAMQLSWGNKSGVPLETIYGVTKGIETEALKRVVEPERAQNCFSLFTPERTIDFEVGNPWLVLLVVRALRLFLGAHYDTLPAPTFFSHLCLRPRGVNRANTPKQTLVWTSSTEKPPAAVGTVLEHSPTERTSGGSTSEDSMVSASTSFSEGDGARAVERSSFDDGEGERERGVEGDEPNGTLYENLDGVGVVTAVDATRGNESAISSEASGKHRGDALGHGEQEDKRDANTSPGGIMALFSSGGRSFMDEQNDSACGGSSESGTVEEAHGGVENGEKPLTASELLATKSMRKRLSLSKRLSATHATTGPLKGKRFELMALPMDQTAQQERREMGFTEDQEFMPKRTQGISISIGAGYDLPEEQKKLTRAESGNVERSAVEDDLNEKLQSLRKLQMPQSRRGGFRPGRPTKTMALKHMAFFQGAGSSSLAGSGMGSITDMWGDGVRRIHQTDTVRQQDQSLEDLRRRDDARTATFVTRSGVHKVSRKGSASDLF